MFHQGQLVCCLLDLEGEGHIEGVGSAADVDHQSPLVTDTYTICHTMTYQCSNLVELEGGISLESCWLERRTRDRKVASSNLGRSGGRIFFSRVNFVCRLLFGVRSTTSVLPQWHVKDPGHSAKSTGGRLHPNTYTPLTQRSRSGLTMLLSRPSMGTYQETSTHATRQGILDRSQSSQLSEPLWTDPGLKSGEE